MITRCPECATAFRISRTQLAARGGRVRCGRCNEVFDAIEALETADDDAADAAAPIEEVLAREEAGAITLASVEDGMREDATPPAAAPAAPTQQPAAKPALHAEESYESEFRLRPRPARAAVAAWSLVALALLVLLAAQLAYHFRGELALIPALKPHAYTLCADLGCDIPLKRDVERLIISSYEVRAEPAQPGIMTLTATLRNLAGFPQEYPALELTLADEQNRALARRVVPAREYLRQIPGEFAAASEHEVRMHFEVASLKPSKYELLLFYP